jgi:hypothetical protein
MKSLVFKYLYRLRRRAKQMTCRKIALGLFYFRMRKRIGQALVAVKNSAIP